MSIKQYFKTKILDPNEDDEDIETDIISQNEESNSEMELGLEEETHVELQNSNHKYIKKKYKNFKSSALGEHASTKDHTDATNREIGKAELIKVTNNAVDKAQEHVDALMKVVFWLAENDIPLNKLPKVIQLCRALECPQILSN